MLKESLDFRGSDVTHRCPFSFWIEAQIRGQFEGQIEGQWSFAGGGYVAVVSSSPWPVRLGVEEHSFDRNHGSWECRIYRTERTPDRNRRLEDRNGRRDAVPAARIALPLRGLGTKAILRWQSSDIGMGRRGRSCSSGDDRGTHRNRPGDFHSAGQRSAAG